MNLPAAIDRLVEEVGPAAVAGARDALQEGPGDSTLVIVPLPGEPRIGDVISRRQRDGSAARIRVEWSARTRDGRFAIVGYPAPGVGVGDLLVPRRRASAES